MCKFSALINVNNSLKIKMCPIFTDKTQKNEKKYIIN